MRRRRRTPRWRFVAVTAVLLTAGVALYSGLEHRRAKAALALPASGPANGALADAPDVVQAASSADRRVFPYSIIPGGAFNADELQRAVAGDPVVAAHYAGFDLARTRVVRLSEPKFAHVSYRIGDNVYWTRRKLVIPAGERVLTDGTHMARTRCGNQIAEMPAGPVAASEPSPAELDTPISPAPRTSQFASLGGPSASASAGGLGGGSGSLASGGGLPGSFGGSFGGGGGAGAVPSGPIALTPPGGPRTPTSGPSNPPPGPPSVPDPPGGPHMPPIQPPGLPPEFNPPTDFVPPTGNDPLPDPPGDDPQPPGDPNDPPQNPPQDPPQDPPKDPPQDPPTRDVPEPGSAVLVLMGAAGMLVRRFRTVAD